MAASTCCLNARIPTGILPATMNISAATSSTVCPNCGTAKKSGKRSCCARGGAWFKKCGDAGDTKFEHTWAEGVQACKNDWPLISVESPPRGMLRDVESIDQTRNTIHQRINFIAPGDMSHAGDRYSHICVGIVHVADHVCIVFITAWLLM